MKSVPYSLSDIIIFNSEFNFMHFNSQDNQSHFLNYVKLRS
jgi:hypothetical protein